MKKNEKTILIVVIVAALVFSVYSLNKPQTDAAAPGGIAGKSPNAFVYDLKNQMEIIYAPQSQEAYDKAKTAMGAYMSGQTLERFCGKYGNASGVTAEVTRLEYGYPEWQDDGFAKVYAEIHTKYDGLTYYTHLIFLFNKDNQITDYMFILRRYGCACRFNRC